MGRKLKRSILAIGTILILIPQNLTSASATTHFPSIGAQHNCGINIYDAHISSYMIKKTNRYFVKVKADSECNSYQERVDLELQIMKFGLFFNHKVGPVFSTLTVGVKSSGIKVSLEKAQIECKNSRQTFYCGVAKAKAFINGTQNYAQEVRSPHVVKLACGT
jgi:hypothetical protein